jgi:hypothetical protein
MSFYSWMTWGSIAVLIFGSIGVFMWFLSDVLSFFAEEGDGSDDSPGEGAGPDVGR